jgi:hypothetical protein
MRSGRRTISLSVGKAIHGFFDLGDTKKAKVDGGGANRRILRRQAFSTAC